MIPFSCRGRTRGDAAASAAISAARAQPVQLHVAAIDPESVQPRSFSVPPDGDLIEVDVPHLAATPAHEMMMVIRVDFELDRRAAALQRADQAGAHEFLYVAVHGRV